MKKMNQRMRSRSMNVSMESMHEYCCRQMMTTAKKESIYIIISKQRIKRHEYEKNSISNSSFIEYQHQHYLG